MLADAGERKLAANVAKQVHAEEFVPAARSVADYCGLELKIETNKSAVEVLQHYLHHLLNENGMEESASILWTPTQFNPGPKYTQDVWNLFDTSNQGLIMGGGSCSKSYGMGVRLFLEWLRDPEWTWIQVVGPSEKHLERNLFSHLVSLHRRATLPMPGEVGELFIGLDRRDQMSSISGVVIPKGSTQKAARLQGSKRRPRVSPHPEYGPLSRMFIFVDEIENVPGGLWTDIDNVLSNAEEEGHVGGFKIFGAYNPTNQHDEVGKRAEPTFGWENFDIETHYRWKSKRGWDVLRLDGERCENVVQGKVVYPGLQSKGGLDKIARNAGGKESAGYYSMGRGAYPPTGVSLSIIPPGMIPKIRGEFIWYDTPQPVGACDLALDGGDAALFSLGQWGRATGMKLPASIDFPQGKTVMFRDKFQRVVPRWGLQLDQQFPLEKGDTVQMKDRVLEFVRRAKIRPHLLCLDKTGHTRGVVDLIKHEWSSAVHGVNFSDGASDTKLTQEDTMTCKEAYDRMFAELWFALRAFAEFGYLLINPAMDITKLTPQLTQRQSKPSGKQTKVESKRDFMVRTSTASPNEADSLTLLVDAVRKGTGFVPSMNPTEDNPAAVDEEDEGWGGHDGVRIDITNRTDYLDDRM